MPLPKLDPALVYKLLPRAAWEQALRERSWSGSAHDLRDGFVHLSAADQLAGTLERYFAAVDDLVLVGFDPAALAPALRWEPARDGALFPHLYGPLPAAGGQAIAWRPVAGADWREQLP